MKSEMQSATESQEISKSITIVGKIVKSGARRYVSVPNQYRNLIDAIEPGHVLVVIKPIASSK